MNCGKENLSFYPPFKVAFANVEKHCSDQNSERFCTIVTLATLDKGEKGQLPAAKSFLCLRLLSTQTGNCGVLALSPL